jgi:hypothetical protein
MGRWSQYRHRGTVSAAQTQGLIPPPVFNEIWTAVLDGNIIDYNSFDPFPPGVDTIATRHHSMSEGPTTDCPLVEDDACSSGALSETDGLEVSAQWLLMGAAVSDWSEWQPLS